jgi:hypothetical protein
MSQTVMSHAVQQHAMSPVIPQPVTDRIENEWRQMREISAQTKSEPAAKK